MVFKKINLYTQWKKQMARKKNRKIIIKQTLHNKYTASFLFYDAQFVQQPRQTVRNPTFVHFGTPRLILNKNGNRYVDRCSIRRKIE